MLMVADIPPSADNVHERSQTSDCVNSWFFLNSRFRYICSAPTFCASLLAGHRKPPHIFQPMVRGSTITSGYSCAAHSLSVQSCSRVSFARRDLKRCCYGLTVFLMCAQHSLTVWQSNEETIARDKGTTLE